MFLRFVFLLQLLKAIIIQAEHNKPRVRIFFMLFWFKTGIRNCKPAYLKEFAFSNVENIGKYPTGNIKSN